MFDLILYAIPVFVALLAAEWVSFAHNDDPRYRGYATATPPPAWPWGWAT